MQGNPFIETDIFSFHSCFPARCCLLFHSLTSRYLTEVNLILLSYFDTEMKSTVCERCLCKTLRVAFRISDENLCETCEQQRLRSNRTRPRPSSSSSLATTLSSELNVHAPPFQPWRALRRSRSTGAILRPVMEKETLVKRKSPPSK